MDRWHNFIPNGSFRNPGKKPGYADLILWGKDQVWVWEFKHKGGRAEDTGGPQLDNYIKYLRIKLKKEGDDRKVEKGFNFFLSQAGPNLTDPTEDVFVESSFYKGIELYWAKKREEQDSTSSGSNANVLKRLGAAGLLLGAVVVAGLAAADDATGVGVVDDAPAGAIIGGLMTQPDYMLGA